MVADTSPVKQIEELCEKTRKGAPIGRRGKVEPVLGADAHYIARSEAAGSYLVNGHCTCPDARYRRDIHKGWCKHMLAVDLYKESQAQVEPQELAPVGDGRSLDEQLKDLFEGLERKTGGTQR